MREIKFRAWAFDDEFMVDETYSDDDFVFTADGGEVKLLEAKFDQINQAVSGYGKCNHSIVQYTGLKDKNGVEICDDDLLNVFFTSGNGEHIHDCIYRATRGALGGIQFVFVRLLWSCHGHNQYPSSTTLCERHESLDYEYEENEIKLKVPDSWGENHLHGNKWKQNDKGFYFEVIGNIYENPELLEK